MGTDKTIGHIGSGGGGSKTTVDRHPIQGRGVQYP